WFARDGIHIYHRSRPARAMVTRRNKQRGDDPNAAVDPITFGFDHKLKLKSLKVIPVSDIETNKYPHPIWQLLSDSNSAPIKDFTYGSPIQGMKPAVKGALPDPLEPRVKYRLFVETEKFKAEHDFEPVPRTP